MVHWQQEERVDKGLKIILFIVSPFIAALYALRNSKTKSSFVVFYLFAVFFGLSFTVPSGKTAEIGIDGASYREKFDRYIRYFSNQDYFSNLRRYFFSDDSKDFYFFSLSHWVSQVTENYHVLFMLIAAVFAFFALKSLKFFILEKEFRNTVFCFLLVYLFMMNDIFNINGVRFWTAAWIGVYCIFQLFRNNNKKYFILACITPLIHVSFWIYLVVLIGAYFFKGKHKPWVVLFLISFLVSNFSVELVHALIDSLPSSLANLAKTYTNESYLEEQANKGSSFFLITTAFSYLVRIYVNLMVWLFIKNTAIISSNPKTKKLFSFLLIWMTFVNFTMPIPSLGGRFMVMSYPLVAYIWLVNFYGVKYHRFLQAIPFVFIMSFYLKMAYYFEVIDYSFYISSPIYLIYKHILSV